MPEKDSKKGVDLRQEKQIDVTQLNNGIVLIGSARELGKAIFRVVKERGVFD